MNPFEKIQNEVHALMRPVNKLQSVAHAVKFFEAQGITANPGNSTHCVIAEYLKQNIDQDATHQWAMISVNRSVVRVGATYNSYMSFGPVYEKEYPLSYVMQKFIHSFDNGWIPSLITRGRQERSYDNLIKYTATWQPTNTEICSPMVKGVSGDKDSNLNPAILSPVAVPSPMGSNITDWVATHPDVMKVLEQYDAIVTKTGEVIEKVAENAKPKLSALVNA